jgi:hypothetical protein
MSDASQVGRRVQAQHVSGGAHAEGLQGTVCHVE